MKLSLKILFFIFTMFIITVGEVKSSTVVNILQKETSCSFFQESQSANVIFENHSGNSCLKGKNVITCSEWVVYKNTIAAKTGVGKTVQKAITVTPEGVALPKGAKIPNNYVQNPYRSSNYGVFENGKFVEELRIDQATPPGFKGPNQSHFHLDNGGHIFDASKWPWW